MLGTIGGVEGLSASVVLIAILLGVLVVVAFDLFCLVHLAAAGRVGVPAKLAWAVAIVCVSPVAGVGYLIFQSRRRPGRSPGPPVAVPR